MVSPEQRLSALDLLAHPIFKTQSKIYSKEQQIALTTPLSLVEKDFVKNRLKVKDSSVSNKELLELAIVKASE